MSSGPSTPAIDDNTDPNSVPTTGMFGGGFGDAIKQKLINDQAARKKQADLDRGNATQSAEEEQRKGAGKGMAANMIFGMAGMGGAGSAGLGLGGSSSGYGGASSVLLGA